MTSVDIAKIMADGHTLDTQFSWTREGRVDYAEAEAIWSDNPRLRDLALRALETGENLDQLLAAARSLDPRCMGKLSIRPNRMKSDVSPKRSTSK